MPYDVHLLWHHKFWPEFSELLIKGAFVNLAAEHIIRLRSNKDRDKAAEGQLKLELLGFLLLLVGDLCSVKVNGSFHSSPQAAVSQVTPFFCRTTWNLFFTHSLSYPVQLWSYVNNRIKSKRDSASRRHHRQISHSPETASPIQAPPDGSLADPVSQLLFSTLHPGKKRQREHTDSTDTDAD